MATNVIEGAWDDENEQAYVMGTTDVEAARTYYREVYLPEAWGTDQTQEEYQWGLDITMSEPRLVWVNEVEVNEEDWAEIHREPADGRVPVLIWS